ncbi:hypothetical protein [Massilia sp. TWR1-2-2]|uniref:hypothetical protein n=1 Tax=Massilia sp. TWR1-2-2 TaxID=2804584 RepID=UPI003CE82833
MGESDRRASLPTPGARDAAGNFQYRLRSKPEHLAALGRRAPARANDGQNLPARPEARHQSDQAQINQIVAFHRASDQRYAYLAVRAPKEPPDGEKFNEAYSYLPLNNFLAPPPPPPASDTCG